jgi:hypothetical protein
MPGRRDAQLFHTRLNPGPGPPGSVVQHSPPDLSLALSLGDVQARCPADPRPCRAGTIAEEVSGEDSPGNPSPA